MPGQRDPNKRNITLWLERGNIESLKKYAKRIGVPMTDLIQEAIREKCEDWGVDYTDYMDSKYSNRTDKRD